MRQSDRARAVYVGEAPLGAMGFETCLAQAGHELLAVCHDPDAALAVIKEHQPNLIAIGTLRSELRTFRVAQAAIRRWPETPVILFTRRPDDERQIEDAVYIGARAFVDACIECSDLIDVIRRVLVGDSLYSPHQIRLAHSIESLTTRQVDVLRLAARNPSPAVIARRLGITDHTVRNHLAEVRSKLDVHSTRAAVARAQRRKVI